MPPGGMGSGLSTVLLACRQCCRPVDGAASLACGSLAAAGGGGRVGGEGETAVAPPGCGRGEPTSAVGQHRPIAGGTAKAGKGGGVGESGITHRWPPTLRGSAAHRVHPYARPGAGAGHAGTAPAVAFGGRKGAAAAAAASAVAGGGCGGGCGGSCGDGSGSGGDSAAAAAAGTGPVWKDVGQEASPRPPPAHSRHSADLSGGAHPPHRPQGVPTSGGAGNGHPPASPSSKTLSAPAGRWLPPQSPPAHVPRPPLGLPAAPSAPSLAHQRVFHVAQRRPF